jgi:hypothetical protein
MECGEQRREKNAYDILVRIPGRKRPLRVPRHRWKDNIPLPIYLPDTRFVRHVNLS